MKPARLLLFLLLSAGLSCGTLSVSAPDITDLLPRDTDTPGWTMPAGPKKFKAEEVSAFAGARAEDLRRYGFEEAVSAEYASLNDPGRTLAMEIIRLRNPLDAFGIFSIERGFDYQPSGIGADSCRSRGVLALVRGPYYIRVMAAKDYANVAGDMEALARVAGANITPENGDAELPVWAGLLGGSDPRFNLAWYPGGHPAIPSLRAFFLRKIVLFNQERLVFFTRRDSAPSAAGEYGVLLNDRSSPFFLLGGGEPKMAFRKSERDTLVFLCHSREWIFGVMNASGIEDGKKTARALWGEIRSFSLRLPAPD